MGCGCSGSRKAAPSVPSIMANARLPQVATARFSAGPDFQAALNDEASFSYTAADANPASSSSIAYEPAPAGTRILAIITKGK